MSTINCCCDYYYLPQINIHQGTLSRNAITDSESQEAKSWIYVPAYICVKDNQVLQHL